ncbi:MAG: oligosaccharide flippase family protein [Candidatus Eisenbacteria bacterium]|nr:oligosaccharide flippase family protein [Candidatus Eisenbacteria bacterium]
MSERGVQGEGAGQARESSDGTDYRGYLSKATREAGFTFFGRAFALAFGFAANAIIARLLGADVLGVYVLAWTVVMAVSIATTFGIEGGFVRYISMYAGRGEEDRARSVFRLGMRFGFAAGIVGTIAIVVFRGPVANALFKEPRLEPALLLIAFAMLPYTLARLLSAALRALKDMKRSIIGLEVALRVPRLAVFVVLFLLGYRLGGIVTAAVAACIVSAVMSGVFVRKSGSFLVRGPGADVPKRRFFGYSSQMLAETATAFILLHSGRLVLGYFLTSADVGVYNVVALLASLATLFTFSWNAIFSPIIADVYHRGGRELMESLLHAITRWIVLLTLPVFAWLVVSGEGVLAFFGEEFVVGYAALVVLAAAQAIDSMAGSVSSCLAMTRYQRFNVYNILVMAGVSAALNIVLVPRIGIVGASIATGASIVLVNAARIAEGRMLLRVFPFDRSSWKIAVTAVALIGLAVAARSLLDVPRDWYWSIATLVVTYGVAALLTVLLGVSEEDRMVWSSVMGRLTRGRRR